MSCFNRIVFLLLLACSGLAKADLGRMMMEKDYLGVMVRLNDLEQPALQFVGPIRDLRITKKYFSETLSDDTDTYAFDASGRLLAVALGGVELSLEGNHLSKYKSSRYEYVGNVASRYRGKTLQQASRYVKRRSDCPTGALNRAGVDAFIKGAIARPDSEPVYVCTYSAFSTSLTSFEKDKVVTRHFGAPDQAKDIYRFTLLGLLSECRENMNNGTYFRTCTEYRKGQPAAKFMPKPLRGQYVSQYRRVFGNSTVYHKHWTEAPDTLGNVARIFQQYEKYTPTVYEREWTYHNDAMASYQQFRAKHEALFLSVVERDHFQDEQARQTPKGLAAKAAGEFRFWGASHADYASRKLYFLASILLERSLEENVNIETHRDNQAQVKRWLTKALAYCYGPALAHSGERLAHGIDMRKPDIIKAYSLYLQAAARGVKDEHMPWQTHIRLTAASKQKAAAMAAESNCPTDYDGE